MTDSFSQNNQQQFELQVEKSPYYQGENNNNISQNKEQQQQNNYDTENQYNNFKKNQALYQQSRMGYIQKVYLILLVQLFFTIIMTIISMSSKSFMNFQNNNPAIFYLALVFAVIIEITIFCFRKPAQVVPWNYGLLFFYTFCWGYIISYICSVVGSNDDGSTNSSGQTIVIMAAIMTFSVTLALTFYAYYTKTDFTYQGGLLFICGFSLLIFTIFVGFTGTYVLYAFYCFLCVILYGLYLIYDTQLIIGGRYAELGIDDYIIGAMIIYIDIVVIFLRLLQILLAFIQK